MTWPNNYDWRRLDSYVMGLQERDFPSREFWEDSRYTRMTVGTIEFLKRDGWDAARPKRFTKRGQRRDFFGRCNPEIKLIEVVRDLRAWDRDTTLMHELWHSYANEIEDGLLSDCSRDKIGRRNNAVTEWLARRSRTNPALLAAALNFARLRPHVYDKPSYEAALILERPFDTFLESNADLERYQMESG